MIPTSFREDFSRIYKPLDLQFLEREAVTHDALSRAANVDALQYLDGPKAGEVVALDRRVVQLMLPGSGCVTFRRSPFGTTMELQSGEAIFNGRSVLLKGAMLLNEGDVVKVGPTAFTFFKQHSRQTAASSADLRLFEAQNAEATSSCPVAVLDNVTQRRVEMRRLLRRLDNESVAFDSPRAVLQAIHAHRGFSMFVVAADSVNAGDKDQLVGLLTTLTHVPTMLILSTSQVELSKFVMSNPKADFLLAPYAHDELMDRLELLRASTST